MCCKTRRANLRRAFQSVAEWCRRHRHLPVQAARSATRRLVGHFNYFGVNGNGRSLARLVIVIVTERVWLKWLRRRDQRRPLSWERFRRLLKGYPLPALHTTQNETSQPFGVIILRIVADLLEKLGGGCACACNPSSIM